MVCPGSIHYQLELQETAASTGFFTPIPQNNATVEEGLIYLHRFPNDSFMHAYLLGSIGMMDVDAVMRLCDPSGWHGIQRWWGQPER